MESCSTMAPSWASFATGIYLIFLPFVDLVKGGAEVDVESLHIRSDIASRYARTLVTSRLRNTADDPRQIIFDVQLPKTAFIVNFSMTIDDQVYHGNVKEKQEALKQYNRAKKRGESAGLVKQQARDASKFKVSVNVAANNTVTFNLTYEQLLQRKLGYYDHVIILSPGQVVADYKVDVFISESRKIAELKPPTVSSVDTSVETKEELAPVVIDWLSESSAHVGYYPSVDKQSELEPKVPGGTFQTRTFSVRYDVERSADAGEVTVVDGYFVHFVAPKGLKPIPKRLVFVLDTSGSMEGRKIEQLVDAMLTILKDLRPIDSFSIVGFNSYMNVWRRNLVPATTESKMLAAEFVRGLKAINGTDIGSGLDVAFRLLTSSPDSGIPLVMFLTDGQPTVGLTSTDDILKRVTLRNRMGARVMTMAFGTGADYPLLQRISASHNGIARKIYEDADAALQVTGFYDEVSTPVLSNVTISYLSGSVEDDSVTATDFSTLFQGSELVVSGKLTDISAPTFDLSLKGNDAEGELLLEETVTSQGSGARRPTGAELSSFTERLWAYLTIQQLLDRRILASDVELQDIRNRVTSLSLKYGFVTEYTSMVVTKPRKHKPKNSRASSPEDPPRPDTPPSRWKPNSGYADNDPHFVVGVRGLERPLCFDVTGRDGDVWRLISDPGTGVHVHGKVFRRAHSKKTYFGTIVVKTKDYTIKLKPDGLQIDHVTVKWRPNIMLRWKGKRIGFIGEGNVTLNITRGTSFVVMRHSVRSALSGMVRYLGFYMNRAAGLSGETTGLLGDFLHRTVSSDVRTENDGKKKSVLVLTNTLTSEARAMPAVLRHRPDLEHDMLLSCWQVKREDLVGSESSLFVHRRNFTAGQ